MNEGVVFSWFEGEPPPSTPVTQVYGFCFSADGRILLIEDNGSFCLPGGTPEGAETYEETLRREVFEEARALLAEVHLLGYQLVEHDDRLPERASYAQLRAIAKIKKILPQAPDPATGKTFRRVLCPPAEVPILLGWGDAQTDSARNLAFRHWGIEPANPQREFVDV